MHTTFGPLPKYFSRQKLCAPQEHREEDTHKLLSRSDLFLLIYSLWSASETSKSDFSTT